MYKTSLTVKYCTCMASAVMSNLSTRGRLVKSNQIGTVKCTFFREPRRLNETVGHTSCLLDVKALEKQGTIYSLVQHSKAKDSSSVLSGASFCRFHSGSEVKINMTIKLTVTNLPCKYTWGVYVTLAGGEFEFRAVSIINIYTLA